MRIIVSGLRISTSLKLLETNGIIIIIIKKLVHIPTGDFRVMMFRDRVNTFPDSEKRKKS